MSLIFTMFDVIVLKSTNPTQPTSFDEKATEKAEILKWHSHFCNVLLYIPVVLKQSIAEMS